MLELSGRATQWGVESSDDRRIVFDLFAFRPFASSDIPIVVNHDEAMVINAGAATFHQDAFGLHFIVRVAADWCATIDAAAQAGRIHGCSIRWDPHRTTNSPSGVYRVHDASLVHVSVCIDRSPAFFGTYVDVRRTSRMGDY